MRSPLQVMLARWVCTALFLLAIGWVASIAIVQRVLQLMG